MSKFSAAFLHRLLIPVSGPGMIVGAIFWLAALTPSMIPRDGLLLGAIGGLCFSVGYAFTVAGVSLWQWLGFPSVPKGVGGHLGWLAGLVAITLMVVAAFMADDWQNQVRLALALPPVKSSWPVALLAVGLGSIALLLLIGRIFGVLRDLYSAPLRRLLPRRAATLIAFTLAAWSFWAIGNGFLLHTALRALDSSYRTIDALIPADEDRPTDPLKAGSGASLVTWEDLGREGRRRVLLAAKAEEISKITGRPALEPLVVYVGLNSADTPAARAALALKEMQRMGAFNRKLLVIATPTGTGWVDPAAMIPLEIMHGGDVASVSVQYSYLPSWLTLFVDPVYGEETAKAVFERIYGHWQALPRESRPRLFLFGLSLGSLNSDLASDAYSVLGDPFEGALWVGPPFASRTWSQITGTRLTSSPAWLPEARNAGVFRFFNAEDRSQLQKPGWGPVKIAYLQYPSDPITFFQVSMWRKWPDWMRNPQGPGVAPSLIWIPVVSFLQLAFDMMTATTVPKGRGHVYAAVDYAEGWRALTRPPNFDESRMQILVEWLNGRGL